MVRTAMILNTIVTIFAVGFSIWVQSVTPMMIRAGNFERFRDRINDADREAILKLAAEAGSAGITPLVVTSIVWIVLACIVLPPKKPSSMREN
jgi:hypothetical protein